MRIYATEMNVNAALANLRGNWPEVARRINRGVENIFWWKNTATSGVHRDSPVVGFTVFVYDRGYGSYVDPITHQTRYDGGTWCNPYTDYAFDAAFNSANRLSSAWSHEVVRHQG